MSVARPMIPPSASTSLTTVPLAIPPIAGLQDIWPMVSRFWVRRRVRAPRRAASVAASAPACPPPTTITSYRSVTAPSLDSGSNSTELSHLPQPGDPHDLSGRNQEMFVLRSNTELGALPYILVPRAPPGRLVNAHIEHVHSMLIFTVVSTDIGPGPIGLNHHSDAVQLGMPRMEDMPGHQLHRGTTEAVKGGNEVRRNRLRRAP